MAMDFSAGCAGLAKRWLAVIAAFAPFVFFFFWSFVELATAPGEWVAGDILYYRKFAIPVGYLEGDSPRRWRPCVPPIATPIGSPPPN
jgi:hypothetical protein